MGGIPDSAEIRSDSLPPLKVIRVLVLGPALMNVGMAVTGGRE